MLNHITLYLCDNAMGYSLGIPDTFAVASFLQQSLNGPAIKISIASDDGKPITTYGGLTVAADTAISSIKHTQLLILPALGGAVTEHFLTQHENLYSKMNTWHNQGVPILATGAASFLLAQAGLLSNRMCTSNRFSRDQFIKQYPDIDVRSERSIVESDGIYTCIGREASRYVIYYLLSQLSGDTLAKNVENTFSTELSIQAFNQGLLGEQSSAHQDEEIWRIQQWLELHFAEPIALTNLALKANMSLRTFKRRFKDATATAPLQYLQKLRTEQAKDYLKHTNKNIADISRLVGYEDAGHFIRLFRREYAETPDRWRKLNKPA